MAHTNPEPTGPITAEHVRWFADYHAKHPDWGLFSGSLGHDPVTMLDPGPAFGQGRDAIAMVALFVDLTLVGREELARRVRALEQVRAQNTPGGGYTPAPRTTREQALAAVVRGGHSGAVPAGIARAAERILADKEHQQAGVHAELQRMGSTAATSLAALTLEAATGRLHQRQQQALAALRQVFANELDNGEQVPGRRVGPATTGEVISRRGLGGNVNLWRARFTELAHLGAIVKRGTRRCDVTGRECMTWAPAAWPWTPPTDRRSTPAELRALLREAADVIDEAARFIAAARRGEVPEPGPVLVELHSRAIVYRRTADGLPALTGKVVACV